MLDIVILQAPFGGDAHFSIPLLPHEIISSPIAKIEPLDPSLSQQVILVPIETTVTSGWPATRTAFARAHRSFIVFGEKLTTEGIVRACRDGAIDALDVSEEKSRWSNAIEHAAAAQLQWLDLYGGKSSAGASPLVGVSPAIQLLRRTISRIGPTKAAVLVLGESGVGKERVAAALHAAGSAGPFVAINCAALPADLIESELFGVAKGAFTDAQSDRAGLVEQAAGGTLFLDEIGELELQLQSKLLRFLETKQARRLGSNREYHVDVRVVSATNRDLQHEIDAGRFRTDLYYRLAEVTLQVPPLRERPMDVPNLARLFLGTACERFGKYFDEIEPALLARWQQHRWTGNVRELKSTVEQLALLHDGPVMRSDWWEPPAPRRIPRESRPTTAAIPASGAHPATLAIPGKKDRLALARRLIAEDGHDLTWVAAQVGVHPTTLFRWRKSGRLD